MELGTLNTETDWHLQMFLSNKKTNNFRIVPVGRQPHFLSETFAGKTSLCPAYFIVSVVGRSKLIRQKQLRSGVILV